MRQPNILTGKSRIIGVQSNFSFSVTEEAAEGFAIFEFGRHANRENNRCTVPLPAL